MAGRKTPPLFDLLGRSAGQGIGLPRVGSTREPDAPVHANGATKPNGAQAVAEANAASVGGVGSGGVPAPAQQKPVVRVELKPMPQQPAPQPLPQRAPPSALTPAREPGLVAAAAPKSSFWTEASGGRAMRVPTVLGYVLVCAVVTLLLATWFAAYKLGNKAGKDQMAEFVRGGTPKVTEPTSQSKAQQPAPVAQQQPAPSQPPPATDANGMPAILTLDQLIATLKPGGVMAAWGWKAEDVREQGKNYLELATLQRDDAAKAVIYLTASGQYAFAVPLDAKANPANNRSLRYRLIAWPGLTADAYGGGRGEEALKIQNAVARLGKAWGGPSDFRMPQWVKMK